MYRFSILIVFIFLPVFAFAQFEYFNGEQFWRKLQLHSTTDKPNIQESDTVIVVASNRVMDQSTFRYLTEKRDGKQIKYFVVYSGKDKWHVQPVYSLKDAVSLMPD
ncbi:MAG TPA: hypothetical protein PL009_14490, partial [Flavipsychrobacter sp.]|nr:hypothetical protein [Flavipsychrobacter sp.]